ncbi:MAG: hypothetical protein K1X61_02740 [Chitinophagales bacterium]|nr:hypothetical protein [Chitinophagales bacterium]
MKLQHLFFLIVMLLPMTSFAQEQLLVYEDTVNHFTIGVPQNWRYGIPKDKSTSFMAARKAKDSTDLVRENFSVNVLYNKPADLNTAYQQFLSAIQRAPEFKIVEQGEKDINKRHYKWLIETHKNQRTNETVYNYVYFANSGKSVLILTMVSSAQSFHKYRELYDLVAKSLKY